MNLHEEQVKRYSEPALNLLAATIVKSFSKNQLNKLCDAIRSSKNRVKLNDEEEKSILDFGNRLMDYV